MIAYHRKAVEKRGVKVNRLTTRLLLGLMILSFVSLQFQPAVTLDHLWEIPDDSRFGTRGIYYTYFNWSFYVGRIAWEFEVRCVGSDANYDYYTILFQETLTPSVALGARLGGIILSGWTEIDLRAYNYPVDWEPLTRDVTLSVVNGSYWGGYVKWSYSMNTAFSQQNQATFYFTSLICVQKYKLLNLHIKTYTHWLLPHVSYVSYDYNPVYNYIYCG